MADSENRPDLSQLVEQHFSHQALELLFHPRRQPDLELDLFELSFQGFVRLRSRSFHNGFSARRCLTGLFQCDKMQ